MKKLLFVAALLATQTMTYGQSADVNDKTHTRIIDGVVSTAKYEGAAPEVKMLSEKEEVKLKLHYDKHVMLVNSKNYPIEDYIFVQNRDKYINHTLPDYVKLPIAINGKLLSQEERKKVLPGLEGKKVKRIVLVNRASAQHKYANVPFGVIEIFP